MKQPPGYPVSPNSSDVLQLLKKLYGLKQAGRRWYQKLVKIMEALGLKRCDVDQAMFYHQNIRELAWAWYNQIDAITD